MLDKPFDQRPEDGKRAFGELKGQRAHEMINDLHDAFKGSLLQASAGSFYMRHTRLFITHAAYSSLISPPFVDKRSCRAPTLRHVSWRAATICASQMV